MARRPRVKPFPYFSGSGRSPVTVLPVRIGPVPVRRIVGSVDKAQRLTPTFLPTGEGVRSMRFRSVQRAMRRGVPLPPIEVYALNREFYVIDGHNRVAAAIANGVQYLDANIHECVLPENSLADKLANAQTHFERRTGLARIVCTEPAHYTRLLKEIVAYREQLRAADPEITTRDAARRWYRLLFVPVAEPLDLGATVLSFPGRTVSDLYLAVQDHQAAMVAELGTPVSLSEALADFQAKHSRPLVARMLRPLHRHARRAVWRLTGGTPAS